MCLISAVAHLALCGSAPTSLFLSHHIVVVCLCAHSQHHVTDSSDPFMAQETSDHPLTIFHQLFYFFMFSFSSFFSHFHFFKIVSISYIFFIFHFFRFFVFHSFSFLFHFATEVACVTASMRVHLRFLISDTGKTLE